MKIRDQQREALAKSMVANALCEGLADSYAKAFYLPERSQVCLIGARAQRNYLTLDGDGRIVETLSPLGRRTTFSFENLRLTSVTGTDGQTVRFLHDESRRTTELVRGDGARERLELDEKGNLTRYTLADGTFVEVAWGSYGPIEITGRDGTKVRRGYDDQGRLSAITDQLGRTTRLLTDARSLPTRVEYSDGSVEEYEYQGRAIRHSLNGREHANYTIAEAGKLVNAGYADGQTVSLDRDAEGRVVTATSDHATVSCEYDEAGRILSECQNGLTVRYGYDGDGQLTSLALPDGQTTYYEYDVDGRPTAVTDWRGGVQRFAYGAELYPTLRVLPNGLSEQYRTDILGRSGGIQLVGPQGVLWQQTYRRDVLDRIATLYDSRTGERQYQYDRAGHLCGVWDTKLSRAVETYAYDAAENRVASHNGTVAHDERDQLTSDGFFSFRHDALGNRIERSSAHGPTSYLYGRHNQLLEIVRPDGQRIKFGYDTFGRRVWKETEQYRVTYIWAGSNLAQEIVESPAGRHTREYLFLPGTTRPLALQDAAGISYYHCDSLDTTQLLTDSTGSVVWSAEYEAYGVARLDVQTLAQPLRFVGHYYDVETGLHYNRARYYDARLGRYLSRDPAAPVAGVNPYLFVGGDPINYADPLGLWGESWPSWAKTAVTITGALVAGAAVAAAVILAAPLVGVAAGTAGVIALFAGGAAAGMMGGGLDAAMTEGGCVSCGIIRGGLLGLAGATMFWAAAPVGVLAVMETGALVGGATYLLDVATSDRPYDPGDFFEAMALGAVLAPVAELIGGRFVKWGGGGKPGTVAYRGDDSTHDPAGRKPGTRKSHINSNGEMEPANPNGKTSAEGHVNGGEPAKSDSPFTSFKEDPATGKAYGAQESQVDVTRLKQDVASGKVKDVEVIDHDQLMDIHQQRVDKAQQRFDNNPSKTNADKLTTAQRDMSNSARDSEVLIKGTIPKEYVTPPGGRPGDAPQPLPGQLPRSDSDEEGRDDDD